MQEIDPRQLAFRQQFVAKLPFPLDQFQLDALDGIDRDESVVVVAPTGSGKTIVGEYAVAAGLAHGQRAFYTTPMKALSNQKFNDLRATYGNEHVGLLTGDNVINGDAPIVVMTTEVLRNMLYAQSPGLKRLKYVVLDEVHYLQNAYRGPVWEEVIIHTPPEVTLVCLSATVSNEEELSSWIRTVRGSTISVVSHRRPVALEHHYVAAPKKSAPLLMMPTFGPSGRPNKKASDYDPVRHLAPWRKHERHKPRPPDRVDVVELLEQRSMLPAIYFIFSRNACEDAVKAALRERIRLTSVDERAEIRSIAEKATATLSDDDLEILGYDQWLEALENGVSAHHAGMVTPFKEAVEQCFSKALVKVVFATETLALGINMPARSVVIEKLSKFTGESHQQLSPGEFTQLTGRAGRRGIDDVGHAVVLWSNYASFDQVAKLASARTYKLSSSFRPTYNMAANLVRRYQPETARHLLNLSFAQFRNDADIVRMESQLDALRREHQQAQDDSQCELGDVDAWQRQVDAVIESNPVSAEDLGDAVKAVSIGDVISDPTGAKGDVVLVITSTQRRSQPPRLGVLTVDGHRFSLSATDFRQLPNVIRHLELPQPYNPSNRDFIRRAMASMVEELASKPPSKAGPANGVGNCPQLHTHLKALDDLVRIDRDHAAIKERIESRSHSLARQFDQVLEILVDLQYVKDWSLTEHGLRLASTYHESDLFISECNRAGALDGLSDAELAAVMSCITYETRGPERRSKIKFPTAKVAERIVQLNEIWTRLAGLEQAARLPLTRAPDDGFVNVAYDWASGKELRAVLEDSEFSGGDFVRNVRQLVDLVSQQSSSAPNLATAAQARELAQYLNRDVVAASAAVHVSTDSTP